MLLKSIAAMALASGTFVYAQSTTTPGYTATASGSILAQASPTWLPSGTAPAGIPTSYPTGTPAQATGLTFASLSDINSYPEVWVSPPTNSSEVQAAYNAIDWTHVPDAPVHTADANGNLQFTGYDANTDPYCWWSDTNCVTPKVSYLPQDIYYCPRVGDWGLSYDDGPFNPTPGNTSEDQVLDEYAEPNLYNFLASHNDQKATLFYIGSNVATFPAAAQMGLKNGHVICVHTWSHPPMTTMTNEQVVAEFYWTLRAIKETNGITPKCWRPPYGDVDDRVRAIAWQMGMRTIIWDEDSNDWNMPGSGGGTLSPTTVDGYFQGWIDARKNGTDNQTGHVVLEHELNNATVAMAEKWLPTLQQTFNVGTIQSCMNISQPYWEESWVYPTEASPIPTTSNTTSSQSSGGSGTKSGSTGGKSSNSNSASFTTASSSMALLAFVVMALNF